MIGALCSLLLPSIRILLMGSSTRLTQTHLSSTSASPVLPSLFETPVDIDTDDALVDSHAIQIPDTRLSVLFIHTHTHVRACGDVPYSVEVRRRYG